MHRFKKVVIGGTFDCLHLGHKQLINYAFECSDFVYIGIVSDVFAKNLRKRNYQNFYTRRKNLAEFLKQQNLIKRFSLFKIEDIYGTAVQDRSLEAIIVTDDSLAGGNLINARRKSLNLSKLKVIKLDLLEISGEILSSSLIRKGVMNQDGVNFKKLFFKNNFVLPDKLRPLLSKPYGRVLKRVPAKSPDLFVTVGDQTTSDFLRKGFRPKISIIDFFIQRKKVYSDVSELGFKGENRVYEVLNKQAEICSELSEKIYGAYNRPGSSLILVEGEEDLATMPAVLMAPLGANVYYGLRNVGLIEIDVSLKTKSSFLDVLSKFEKNIST